MLVSDLLHSCANDRVAAAAVSSIGGEFATRVQSCADQDGVTIGAYTSRVVRAFALGASEREWRDLVFAVRGQDLPVLAGLQVILSRAACANEDSYMAVPAAMAAQRTSNAA